MTFEIAEKRAPGSGSYIRFPVFTPAENSRHEAKHADRMNKFYEFFRSDAESYIQSEDFPSGAKYRAECRCTEEDGALKVILTLSLHYRGRCTARRTLSHLWKNGVIISEC